MKVKKLELESTVLDPAKFPKSRRPEVAVSGRSNVGKSSLLNKLFSRRNIARVSRAPGKTRTVNFFLVNEDFYLVDLPGYGFAKVSKTERESWQKVIFSYLERREMLAGVIQLVDSRHDPTGDDLKMFQRLIDAERDFLIVLTKADKLKRSQRAGRTASIRSCFEGISVGPYGELGKNGETFEVPFVFTSAVTGEGKDAIWRWIVERI